MLSFRAFAALRGISHQAVSKAVATGRLSNAVQIVNGVRMIDPELAAIEWKQNTSASASRPKRTPSVNVPNLDEPNVDMPSDGLSPKPNISLARVQTQHVALKTLLTKLDYEERTGTLVKADSVRAEIFKLTRMTRDAIRMIPPRISGELAGISDQREIERVLTREIDSALEHLSKPESYGGRE